MRSGGRTTSATSRRGEGNVYPARARRRGGNSFTEQEMSILRDAQLTSIGDGVGRTRTISASYMSSSDWSKGAEVAAPHDFTTIPDRAFGTNRNDETLLKLAEKLGIISHNHKHSAGWLGLERSKAAFAAVRQRFEECDNADNIRWFEGSPLRAGPSTRGNRQEWEDSPPRTQKNQKLQYTEVLREFESRVQRGRSFASPHSGDLSADFLSDHVDDLLSFTKETSKSRIASDEERSREVSTQTARGTGRRSQTLMLVRPSSRGRRDTWLMDGGKAITSPWK